MRGREDARMRRCEDDQEDGISCRRIPSPRREVVEADCLLFTVYCSPFTVHRSLFTVHCSLFTVLPSALQTERFHAVRGRLFHCKRNNPVANIVGLPYSQRYNLRIWNVIIPVFCLNNIRLRIVGLPMSGETNSYFQHGDNRYFLRYLRSTILRHLRGTFFSVKTCWLRTYVTPSGFRFRLCLPFFL